MLDDLKRGNHYYSAVETDKGVLLFDDNTNGNSTVIGINMWRTVSLNLIFL